MLWVDGSIAAPHDRLGYSVGFALPVEAAVWSALESADRQERREGAEGVVQTDGMRVLREVPRRELGLGNETSLVQEANITKQAVPRSELPRRPWSHRRTRSRAVYMRVRMDATHEQAEASAAIPLGRQTWPFLTGRGPTSAADAKE